MTKKPVANGRLITLPLSELHISSLNARANDLSDVSELAALLDSQGQLQNLIVVKDEQGHGVVGGGRRYRAFRLNEQRGKIPADHPVFCLLTDEENALAASVAENSGRDEMHPADQFVAFKSLVETGSSVDEVAARFGCTPLVVRRRLQLAKVSPKLVAAFRAGEMNLEALQAFTLVDSQKLQEKVWNNTPGYMRHAHNLRRALTEGSTDASHDRYAGFVGLDALSSVGIGDIAIKELDKLKKAGLGTKAEELLADSGWLPPILRPKDPPKPAKPKDMPPPAKKAATSKPSAETEEMPLVDGAQPTLKRPINPAAAWPFPITGRP